MIKLNVVKQQYKN